MRTLKELIKEPERFLLANLPTRIEKMSDSYNGVNLYLKRDDQTGFELSGNKIRKLEYALKDAVEKGCDAVITCGGIQTNHGRATVIAATKLGLKPYLVLKSDETDVFNGNYFLDALYGAKIIKVTEDDDKNDLYEVMEDLREQLLDEGIKAYVIPVGASNGIGNLGYMKAVEEITRQEETMGIKFDAIVAAMGSGSTHAGLYLGTKVFEKDCQVIGINISDSKVDAQDYVYNLALESKEYFDVETYVKKEEITIIDDYVGRGYALSTDDEIKCIKAFARREGVLLDTVYTGKAMYGLLKEIENGRFNKGANILFIHTGGAFGNFSKVDVFFNEEK